jgi:predicted ATP-dependent endonuclease of OLD family
MELVRVEIRNYRSLKDINLEFNPKCRILLGKIESGKSNILKAISLLNEEPSKIDIREPTHEEDPIRESEVIFIFKLSEKEKKQIFNDIKSVFYTDSQDPILFHIKNKKVSLKEFCKNLEGFYTIDILDENKYPGIWDLDEGTIISPNIKRINQEGPEIMNLKNKKGDSIDPSKFIFIDSNSIDKDSTNLEEIDAEDLRSYIEGKVTEIVEKKLPKSIFWEYNEENLLPSKIKLSDFSSNPDSCKPLKHIFEFSGYTDISKEIENVQVRSKGLINLLNRVSLKTTNHFHKIWTDYKEINFDFSLNGEFIELSVVDTHNKFDFSQRSDGFKKFITFLFTISLDVASNSLNNHIILIDEPSAGLHPSAEERLKDELINISEKNWVLYSTHSISMVDKENIERHIIVKKKGEITTIENAKESNISDEEVLYNALGYSMFKVLKNRNIIFEGWRDKKLFQVAINNLPKDYSHLKKFFCETGQCHGQGLRNLSHITPLMELANRKCLIISDNDEIAKRFQREFLDKKYPGEWKCYDDIFKSDSILTSEDFIKNEAVINSIRNILKEYPDLKEITNEELSQNKGKIRSLKEWLRKQNIMDDKQKKIIDSIKENLFDNLEMEHIEDSYYEFLENLKKYLDSDKVASKIKIYNKKSTEFSPLPKLDTEKSSELPPLPDI